MVVLNSKEIVSDSLKSFFGLEKYCEIIEEIKNDDFNANEEFQEKFNGYFRIRVKKNSKEWRKKYYDLMLNQKNNKFEFKKLLEELYEVNQAVSVSFVSKLMAAINPDLPIWDSFVLKNLGLDKQWNKYSFKNKDIRIEKAAEIYEQIKTIYSDFLKSEEGKKCIKKFDELFPDYKEKISDVKKIDFWLWSKRNTEEKK